jgi:large subunit ribosomal protein L23
MSRPPAEVIERPVITERSYALHEKGRYTFRVATNATKPEIAQALQDHYGVNAIKVNTLTMRGKVRRTQRRGISGRTPGWKKAIVTLAPGQKIEGLFGGV